MMLRQLLTLTCMSAAAAVAQTNYPGYISGCVARYSFSAGAPGVLNDVSGNSNNGITTNMTAVPGWRGGANSAMKFNGSTSYVSVPHASNLNFTRMTMVALVKFDGFYGGKCQYSMMMCKGAPGFSNGVYSLGVTDQIFYNDCDQFDSTHIMRSDYFGANSSFITPSSTIIQKDGWYLMISTFDSLTWTAYQVVMDSTNLLPSISPMFTVGGFHTPVGTNSMPLTIGKMNDATYPYWLRGSLDEVALFNRALTNDEVYKIYYFLFKGYPLGMSEELSRQSPLKLSTSKGILHLNSLDGDKIGQLMIYNLQGQTLLSENINSTNTDLDIRHLPNGILFAKVLHRGLVSTLKIPNL